MPASPSTWSLLWEPLFSVWVLVALAAGALALLTYQFRRLRRRLPLRSALALAGLRGLALLLLFALLLGPALIVQQRQRLVPSVAVLVDNSASMGLRDGDPAATRLDKARRALGSPQAGLLHDLAGRFHLETYLFSDEPRRVSESELNRARPDGDATRIQEAISDVAGRARREPLAGIVLLSDGARTDNLPPRAPPGVPVVAIPMGNPEQFRDIAVTPVNVPPLGFTNIPLDLDFSVRTHGYGAIKLPLILRRGERILQTKTVTVPAAGEERVRFTLTPQEVGDYQLSLGTPVRAEEEIAANNRAAFTVRVLRDRIRILIVSGSPSWDYRFLREALKRDPTIDLVSFVILRTPLDEVDAPENELSLIPFPTDRLFTQELQNFDLIIFDNFTYLPYFPYHYLENIRKFVEKGGAFAMFGGASSFRDGGYAGTPIEKILPVDMGDPEATYQASPLSASLTRAGENSPLTRLSSDGASPGQVWGQLPPLGGYNRVAGLKKGAVVLVDGHGISGDTEPLLVVGSYGRGRTLAFLSDYLWRWNFTAAGEDQSNRPYLQFVHRMVRWLIRDPELDPLVLRTDRSVYEPGDEVTIRLRVLDRDYSPARNPSLTVTLQGPGGERLPLTARPGDKPGDFIATWRSSRAGDYRVRAEARSGQELLGRAESSFAVRRGTLEAASGFPDLPTLKTLATSSGGMLVPPQDLGPGADERIVRFLDSHPRYRLLTERRLPLGQTPWAFALLTLVLCGEWFLRRRQGLP